MYIAVTVSRWWSCHWHWLNSADCDVCQLCWTSALEYEADNAAQFEHGTPRCRNPCNWSKLGKNWSPVLTSDVPQHAALTVMVQPSSTASCQHTVTVVNAWHDQCKEKVDFHLSENMPVDLAMATSETVACRIHVSYALLHSRPNIGWGCGWQPNTPFLLLYLHHVQKKTWMDTYNTNKLQSLPIRISVTKC